MSSNASTHHCMSIHGDTDEIVTYSADELQELHEQAGT